MKKMIAYCGLDCEKCDAYIATVQNDRQLREKISRRQSLAGGPSLQSERR